MSRDLIGLDVIIGDDLVRPQQPRETYEGRQHMGPGGVGWSAHGKNFWNEANFWGDWWPYGREVDIDEVVGATWPVRPGTARDFGLLDMAYACVVGAHLAASKPLLDYAKQISGQILNQTTPTFTAPTYRVQLEALAGEIAKITKSNPLTKVYSGPVFQQSHNDLFSGKLGDTASHAMAEAAPEIKKKFDDAVGSVSSFLTTIKWVGIAGAGAVVLALAAGLGFGLHNRLKK